jgi:hypothetical protein
MHYMSLIVDGEASFETTLHGGVPFHIRLWVGVLIDFKVHFEVDPVNALTKMTCTLVDFKLCALKVRSGMFTQS